MSSFSSLALVAAILASGLLCRAQSTENSLLDCDKTQAVPGERISCRIYVRDSQMDPSIGGRAADFAVRVTVDRDDSGVTVTPVVATDDVMVFAFSVTARLGTNLRIDVVLAATGGLIRGSGFAVVVLIAPTSIQSIQCNTTSLVLRSTVLCQAALVGPEGRPAVVGPRDVVLTEDHSEGQFQFVAGIRSLTFTYTAPNFLSTTFSAFVLRATLMSAASGSVTVSLPVTYPRLPPSAKSVIKCSAGTCNVLSFDDMGPILFDPTAFVVSFARPSSSAAGAPLIPVTNFMKFNWVNLPFSNAKNLVYDALVPNEVFTCQLSVTTVDGTAIVGSPVTVTIGVAPTPADVNFYRCLSSFVTAGLSTTCYLLVADSATADPKFLAIQAAVGLVGEARYRNVTNDPLLVNRRVIAFDYVAPLDVKRRTEDNIFITIGGVSVGRTPWRMILFPDMSDNGGVKVVDRKGSVIVVGSIFFGGVYLAGIIAWARRQRRRALVHEARRIQFLQASAAEVLEEMQQQHKQQRRPETPVTRTLSDEEKVRTPAEGWMVPPMPAADDELDEEDFSLEHTHRTNTSVSMRDVVPKTGANVTSSSKAPAAAASPNALAQTSRASSDWEVRRTESNRPDDLVTSIDRPPSPAATATPK